MRLFLLRRWMRDPLPVLDALAERYGSTFTLPLALLPYAVVTSEPELIKEVFADNGETYNAGEANVILKPFLGEHSLLLLDGPRHKRERKLLMPPFHGERMEAYGHTMLEAAHEAIDGWPTGYHFTALDSMQHVTLRIIVRTIFGIDDAERVLRVEDLLRRTMKLASWAPLILPPLQRDLGPWSPWGRYQRTVTEANGLLMAEVERRRKAGTAGRTDIVSLLLDARDEQGEPMSHDELRDELTTLLAAGHETTATALSWCLDLLLDHPAVWQRLCDEVRGCEGPDGELLPARLGRNEYVDAVLRETLRLRPVVPMVGRVLKRPLKLGAYDLPAETVVLPSIYLASQRPEVFEEPRSFKPERFLGRRFAGFEWFPFGGGVRRCVGMAFALYEMKMVLGAIVQRATLARAPGSVTHVLRRSVTLGPHNGVRLMLVKRAPRRARVPAAA